MWNYSWTKIEIWIKIHVKIEFIMKFCILISFIIKINIAIFELILLLFLIFWFWFVSNFFFNIRHMFLQSYMFWKKLSIVEIIDDYFKSRCNLTFISLYIILNWLNTKFISANLINQMIFWTYSRNSRFFFASIIV